MPAALKMQAKFGDDVGTLFVHAQQATPEQAERFALAQKWTDDRAIWTSEQPFQIAGNGLPYTVLLGNDGEVLFADHPIEQKIEKLIEEQLKLAKKGAKDLPPACAAALADFEKGNCAAAIKALDAVQDGPDKEAAKKLAASLNSRANAKVAKLEWLIEAAEFEQADKLAPALAKSVAGDEKLEAKVKDLAAKLASQEMATERDAAKALGRILARIDKDGVDAKSTPAIVKDLTNVTEKFPKTRAAKRAEHLAQIAQTKPS